MKIKYSALVSDVRNKLNGSVAAKNRYGSYLRNKITPVNPQTSFQQAARQTLGAISSAWRSLTASARASWNAGGVNFPFTDIFGDIRYLSGQALYVKLNANLVKVGAPQITVAPLPVGIPEIGVTAVNVTAAAGTLSELTLDMSVVTVPAGFALAVFATPPQAPGRSFVKNEYRFIGTGTVAGSEADITAAYTERFGSEYTAGQNIFVRLALVSTDTGQQGVPVQSQGAA